MLFLYTGQTPSGSTAQFTPNSSFSVVSPNQSASFLSPDKARQSSSTPVGSLNSSDGEGKVSWTVGGSENVEGNLRSETADSVNLEAGNIPMRTSFGEGGGERGSLVPSTSW